MKRILSLLLSLALLAGGLTGCSLFDRTNSYVTTHQEQSPAEEDPAILRAENYADLVSCVQHFVSMGQDTGTVHVYKYSGDIEADLNKAASEIRTEDPLGAYALKDITYDYSRIVSYYECNFTFSYRRDAADMAAIVSAYGTAAIRNLFQQAMSNFEHTLTIRTSSFYSDRTTLYSLAQEAYYASPATALGYPEITISVYPDSGIIRILEINFAYDYWDRDTLLQHEQAVNAAVVQMAGTDTAADATVAWLLYSRLMDNTHYNSNASSSVYDALCQGSSNSEGIALAYLLLCRQAGIDCQLVQGTLGDTPHWWNLITLEGTSWMVDITQGNTESDFLHNDDTLSAAGFHWSREDYPVCDGAISSLPHTPEQ